MMNSIKIIQTKPRRFLLLLASALLTGLTLVVPVLGFLEWVTLIPLGLFLLSYAADPSVRLRALYGYGLCFFWCFYIVVFHWFVNLYPLDFIDGMTKGGALAVVLVAWLGLSLLQALMGGLVFVVAGAILRVKCLERAPLAKPFLIAGIYAFYEWTQTLGWWGVPWGRLPLGQAKYLVGLQTASLLGSYFVTFVLVAVNAALAFALLTFLGRKGEGDETEPNAKRVTGRIRVACVVAAGLIVFQYGAGSLLWFTSPKGEESIRAAAIQGNISSHEKWDFNSITRTREIYREYTLRAAEQGAQIVVWPETALPYVVDENTAYLTELAKEAEVTILVGAFTNDGVSENDYNSLACYLPDGSMHETVYSKRRLVPFGEFVPFSKLIETLIPPLAELVMSSGSVEWGEGSQLIELKEGSIGSLICFDSIYEELTRESVRDGAELICLSTNDSWFTDSVALDMHNAQAQLRAIESGRYVVRAANTGISTVITERGEVIARLEPLVDGMLVEDVEIRSNTTLYTLIGNTFVYLWGVALAALLGVRIAERIIQRREKRSTTKNA